MGEWVDYKRIKEEVGFPEVLDYYQLELATKGDEMVGVCPLPDHAGDRDNANAFHISLEKSCFHCLTHCGGGNIIDFTRLMEELPDTKKGFRDAALLLQQRFLSEVTDESVPAENESEAKSKDKDKKTKPKSKAQSPTTDKTVNEPLSFSLEKKLKYDHPWLLEEKQFPQDLLEKFGIGWCKTGLMAGRIVFPIHNASGKLVAYAGRALTEKDEQQRGKYLFPSGYNKSLELWNFHRIVGKKKLIRDFGIILVEGFTDALRLIQHGIDNVVALMGWSMSEQQQELILSITDKIVLSLDNDEAGIEATKKIHQRLIHQLFIKVVPYPDDSERNQPEHFSKQEIAKMLNSQK